MNLLIKNTGVRNVVVMSSKNLQFLFFLEDMLMMTIVVVLGTLLLTARDYDS